MVSKYASIVVLGVIMIAACAEKAADEAPINDSAAAATTATTPSAAPAPVEAGKACAVLTAEELKQVGDIDGEGKPSTSGGADVCSWFGSNGALVLQIYPYASSYENSREAFEDLYETKAQDVSGVGDKAFYMSGKTSGMDTGTMSAQQGTRTISVQILGGTAATHKDRVTALTKAVLAKL